MDKEKQLGQLYQHAAAYRFDEFNGLFCELEAALPFELFWEAYLMRAQIRLFAADHASVDDLRAVALVDRRPQFACLNTVWEADSPNRFIVFSTGSGILRQFMSSLYQLRDEMTRWYGLPGELMTRQMQCNLLYWTGDIQESLALVEESLGVGSGTHTDTFLLVCARFRCCLALGDVENAEQCILELIRMSKRYPECVAPYLSFRGWANITTSSNGDTPRFTEDLRGKRQPVFDERLEDIREGSTRKTPLETAFTSFAEHQYQNAYALRQYYVDVFHGMYWLMAGDKQVWEACARRIYDIARATGIIMPIVECGEQVMPLLRHMQRQGEEFSAQWLTDISQRAQAYEHALERYCATSM